MVSVLQKLADSRNRVLVISDFTPPRNGDPNALESISGLGADFIGVAYSPGRLVRMSGQVAAYMIQEKLNQDVIFNLTPRDMNKIALGSYMFGAQALGLENVIVTQGDELTQRERDHGASPVKDLSSTGLIRLINDMNQGLDYRGSKFAKPTDFCVGATVDLNKNMEQEVDLAERKIQSGARFLITQPIYEIAQRDRFLNLYEQKMKKVLAVPVFWGVQVLDNEGVVLGNVPQWINNDLVKGRSGSDIAQEIMENLAEHNVQGIYLLPTIFRNGARDYAAARGVISAFSSRNITERFDGELNETR